MSPLEIHMLLHYYACVDDYPNNGYPAQGEVLAMFLREYLLEPQDSPVYEAKYKLLPRGKAYCEALIATPLPEFVPGYWRVPNAHKVD